MMVDCLTMHMMKYDHLKYQLLASTVTLDTI